MDCRRGVFAAVLAGLLLLTGCGGGGGGASTPRSAVALSISPTSANVIVGQSTSIFATLTGSTNTLVNWQVNGVAGGNATVGTITLSGLVVLYTAPAEIPSPATVTIKAISQADTTKTSSATFTVVAGVLIIPPSVNATLRQQATLSATVLGASDTTLVWDVNGIVGGDAASVGTIDAASQTVAYYTSPNHIPNSPVAIHAVLQSDPSVAGTVSVMVSAGGPNVFAQSAPIKLGTSGGNVNDVTGNFCCSGTLGSLVIRNGTNYILSNNHVLARRDLAAVGEHITQPGLVDTNCAPGLEVATFSQAAKINNASKTAAADAALAQIVTGQVDLTGTILQLGVVVGSEVYYAPPASTTTPATIGMLVAKSGRSSGLTCGTVSETNATVLVDYETGCNGGTTFTITFNNQVVVDSGTFGIPGDSGSLIVDAQTAQPVALLFAGDSTTTIGNAIDDVLNALPDNSGNFPTFVGGAQHTVMACTGDSSPPGPGGPLNAAGTRVLDASLDKAIAAKEHNLPSLMKDPAVLGMGVGVERASGQAQVVIYVDQAKLHAPIPDEIDGVPTQVKSVERFHAFNHTCDRLEVPDLLRLP